MRNKLLPISVTLIFDVLVATVYWYVENNLLTWLYSSTYVGITATMLYIAAMASFLLSGKRAIKMAEWPTMAVITSFLLAIVTKLAK